jgi:hypothetical protein
MKFSILLVFLLACLQVQAANVLKQITVGGVKIAITDADPTTGGGTDLPAGSIAIFNGRNFVKGTGASTDWGEVFQTNPTTGDANFTGDVTATAFIGDGSQLTGISGAGGVSNPGDTTVAADNDADGTGEIGLETFQLRRMTIKSGGNIGIGTQNPDASAILDILTTTQGILPPRLTTIQRDAVASPGDGLTIFNTDNERWETYRTDVAAWRRSTNDTFLTTLFRIQDTTDPTKQIAFDGSAITTGNVSTIQVPQGGVDLADIALNNAKVSADGSVTTHSDVTNAGSGLIITAAERTDIGLNNGHRLGDGSDHADVASNTSDIGGHLDGGVSKHDLTESDYERIDGSKKNIQATSDDGEAALTDLDDAIGALIQGTNYTASNAAQVTEHLKGIDSALVTASAGVTGPVSSTDDAIAVWDGTDGDAIKNSTIKIVSGALRVPDGLVGAPPITFETDLDTGIFLSSADTLDITRGGATGVRVGTDVEVFTNIKPNGAFSSGECAGGFCNPWLANYSRGFVLTTASDQIGSLGSAHVLPDGTTSLIDFRNAEEGQTGPIAIASLDDDENDANKTNDIFIGSGNKSDVGATGDSGSIKIRPGTVAGSGARGTIDLNSDIINIFDGSEAFLTTANANVWWGGNLHGLIIDGEAADINLQDAFQIGMKDTTDATADGVFLFFGGTSHSGAITSGTPGGIFILSDNLTNASATVAAGDIDLEAGQNAGTGRGGDIKITAGANTNAASTDGGDVNVRAGGSTNTAGNGGDVILLSGNGATTSGDILLDTDHVTNDGKIIFQNGSQGTAGHVWTSLDTSGSGGWAVAPVPDISGKADTDLGNLSSVAINADLLPDSAGARVIGTTALRFGDITGTSFVGKGANSYLTEVDLSDVLRFRIGRVNPTTPGGAASSQGIQAAEADRPLAFYTNSQTGSTNSQDILIESGNVVDGDAGNIEIRAGKESGTGSDGEIILYNQTIPDTTAVYNLGSLANRWIGVAATSFNSKGSSGAILRDYDNSDVVRMEIHRNVATPSGVASTHAYRINEVGKDGAFVTESDGTADAVATGSLIFDTGNKTA